MIRAALVALVAPMRFYADTSVRIGPGPFRPLTIQPDAQMLLTRERTAAIVAARAVIAL